MARVASELCNEVRTSNFEKLLVLFALLFYIGVDAAGATQVYEFGLVTTDVGPDLPTEPNDIKAAFERGLAAIHHQDFGNLFLVTDQEAALNIWADEATNKLERLTFNYSASVFRELLVTDAARETGPEVAGQVFDTGAQFNMQWDIDLTSIDTYFQASSTPEDYSRILAPVQENVMSGVLSAELLGFEGNNYQLAPVPKFFPGTECSICIGRTNVDIPFYRDGAFPSHPVFASWVMLTSLGFNGNLDINGYLRPKNPPSGEVPEPVSGLLLSCCLLGAWHRRRS